MEPSLDSSVKYPYLNLVLEICMESMEIDKELMGIYMELMEKIVVLSLAWIEQKTAVYFLPNLTNP